jgi:hypothetical protein
LKDLNLIPQSYILVKRKATMKLYTTLAYAGVFIVIAAMIVLPIGVRVTLQWKMSKLEQQVNETSNYMQTEKQFSFIEDLYNQRLKEGNSIGKSGVNIKKVIGAIEMSSPERLYIKDFSTADSLNGTVEISLNGVAASEDEVASFVQYLRDSKCFNKVIITSVRKMTGSAALSADYTFEISLQYQLEQ